MKIIAFEGLDKSGKHSQSTLLYDKLKAMGHRVERSEFHRYDTPTGKLIMEFLTGKWEVSQHTIELIMAADKQAQQDWIAQLEEAGIDYLILDRYTGSQTVYAAAQGVSPMWTERLLQYVREPDVELIIDIPTKESMSRKGKHNDGQNDRYESDFSLLQAVRAGYLRRDAITINGLQTKEQVHQDVCNALSTALLVKKGS